MKDKADPFVERLSDDELAKLAFDAQRGDEKSLERVLIELSGMVRAGSCRRLRRGRPVFAWSRVLHEAGQV